jgi:hypothetical protein
MHKRRPVGLALTCQPELRAIKHGFMILKMVNLQEANGLLPLVRDHFFRIHLLLASLQKNKTQASKKYGGKLLLDTNSVDIVVIKRKLSRKKRNRLKSEIQKIEAALNQEFNNLFRIGAVIKSLFPPHIDFLSLKNNELVYLCWHGGDEEITHWHYVEDGPPIRQPIALKARFGPHVVH